MTKDCKSCRFWESKKDSPAYQTFIEKHDCSINHTGSAGSMEPAGILRCFLRFVGTGDGDSKAFLEVVNADPYNGIQVKKR